VLPATTARRCRSRDCAAAQHASAILLLSLLLVCLRRLVLAGPRHPPSPPLSPATSHQSPVTSHQPPATSHQPPDANRAAQLARIVLACLLRRGSIEAYYFKMHSYSREMKPLSSFSTILHLSRLSALHARGFFLYIVDCLRALLDLLFASHA
jgi:hypothetical protein